MNDEYLIYGETLTNIADSIRSVSSVSTTWTPDEMAAYILANLVKPTTRQAAKTYTPSTSNQTIPAGTFLTGAATITGEPNYVEGNIKKGTKMWNKTGTLSGIWGVPDTFYGFTAVKSGSFTVTNKQTANYTVTHNLGSVPKLVMLYAENAGGISNVQHEALGGVMAFQTTSQTEVSAPTSSGVYMLTALYYNYEQKFNVFSGVAATPRVGNNGTRNTMLNTTNSNPGGKTPITSLTNSSFIIPYNTLYYMSAGTFKWLVMG